MHIAQNTNYEDMHVGMSNHVSGDPTAAAVRQWFDELRAGIDIPDSGQTYQRPQDHVYPRGGTLGKNAARDADDGLWERHRRGNPAQ